MREFGTQMLSGRQAIPDARASAFSSLTLHALAYNARANVYAYSTLARNFPGLGSSPPRSWRAFLDLHPRGCAHVLTHDAFPVFPSSFFCRPPPLHYACPGRCISRVCCFTAKPRASAWVYLFACVCSRCLFSLIFKVRRSDFGRALYRYSPLK